jgi:hypothetical protein
MIIYDLSCANDHRFEGWFRNADDFSAQLDRGLVACPQCGQSQVRRIPSAVSIASNTSNAKASAQSFAAKTVSNAEPSATQAKAMIRQIINEVLATSEDVGSEFAAEARRIHYHAAPDRSIRGQASSDQVSELIDEGIDVVSMPSHYCPVKPQVESLQALCGNGF